MALSDADVISLLQLGWPSAIAAADATRLTVSRMQGYCHALYAIKFSGSPAPALVLKLYVTSKDTVPELQQMLVQTHALQAAVRKRSRMPARAPPLEAGMGTQPFSRQGRTVTDSDPSAHVADRSVEPPFASTTTCLTCEPLLTHTHTPYLMVPDAVRVCSCAPGCDCTAACIVMPFVRAPLMEQWISMSDAGEPRRTRALTHTRTLMHTLAHVHLALKPDAFRAPVRHGVPDALQAQFCAPDTPSSPIRHRKLRPNVWDPRHCTRVRDLTHADVAGEGAEGGGATGPTLLDALNAAPTHAGTYDLVDAALRSFERVVVPVYARSEDRECLGAADTLRQGWAHHDAHECNVFMARHAGSGSSAEVPEDACCPCATSAHTCACVCVCICDWDDAAVSYPVHDVAIALTYSCMNAEMTPSSVLRFAASALQAYASVRELTNTEMRTLLYMMRARLCVSLCMSAVTVLARSGGTAVDLADPATSYVLMHKDRAVSLLRVLMDIDPDAAFSSWCTACGLSPAPPPVLSYVYAPTLSTEQRVTSTFVKAALAWLGAHRPDTIHAVIHVQMRASCASEHRAGTADGPSTVIGSVPAGVTPKWTGAVVGGWREAPFVYDFTRNTKHVLGDVVGTDPDGLAAFTEYCFQPLVTVQLPPPSKTARTRGVDWFHYNDVARIGWGRYGEDRTLYQSDHFVSGDTEPRTMHLGVDLEAPPMTPLHATLPGKVHSIARNLAELDYGPAIVLEHHLRITTDAGSHTVVFYVLYGHLTVSSIVKPDGTWRWQPGDVVHAGDIVGFIGDVTVNGGWPPHTHFQINTELDLGGWRGDYPGVCALSDWPTYRLLCPDPNLLLRCPFVEPVDWDPTTTYADCHVEAVEPVTW